MELDVFDSELWVRGAELQKLKWSSPKHAFVPIMAQMNMTTQDLYLNAKLERSSSLNVYKTQFINKNEKLYFARKKWQVVNHVTIQFLADCNMNSVLYQFLSKLKSKKHAKKKTVLFIFPPTLNSQVKKCTKEKQESRASVKYGKSATESRRLRRCLDPKTQNTKFL